MALTEQRDRGADRVLDHVAEPAAVLHGGGDQLAQSTEQHDRQRSGNRADRAFTVNVPIYGRAVVISDPAEIELR